MQVSAGLELYAYPVEGESDSDRQSEEWEEQAQAGRRVSLGPGPPPGRAPAEAPVAARPPTTSGCADDSLHGQAPHSSLAQVGLSRVPRVGHCPQVCSRRSSCGRAGRRDSHRAARATWSRAPAWTLTTWSNTEDGVFSKRFGTMHMVSSPGAGRGRAVLAWESPRLRGSSTNAHGSEGKLGVRQRTLMPTSRTRANPNPKPNPKPNPPTPANYTTH